MKIYSRKNLFGGICYTCLALLYLWQNRGQLDAISPIDWSILACVIAAACIRFYTAFSKKTGRQAMIEENDEREKLLQLKIYRTSFWTGSFGLFLISWFAESCAGDEAAKYVSVGIRFSAVLLLLFHFFVSAAYSFVRSCRSLQ